MQEKETWQQNQKFVLTALDKIDNSIRKIHNDITEIKVEIGMLKVKSGVYGFIGSALALLIAILIGYFK